MFVISINYIYLVRKFLRLIIPRVSTSEKKFCNEYMQIHLPPLFPIKLKIANETKF